MECCLPPPRPLPLPYSGPRPRAPPADREAGGRRVVSAWRRPPRALRSLRWARVRLFFSLPTPRESTPFRAPEVYAKCAVDGASDRLACNRTPNFALWPWSLRECRPAPRRHAATAAVSAESAVARPLQQAAARRGARRASRPAVAWPSAVRRGATRTAPRGDAHAASGASAGRDAVAARQ